MTARWQKYDQEKLRALGRRDLVLKRRVASNNKVLCAEVLASNPETFSGIEYFDPSELADPVGPLGEPIYRVDHTEYNFDDMYGRSCVVTILNSTGAFSIRLRAVDNAPTLTISQQRHLIQILQANVEENNHD